MLPKPEKIKKTQIKAQQLDLVETVSSEDKLKNKRKYLLLSLFLTIGVSFVFWGYTLVKNFISSPSLPRLSLTLPQLSGNIKTPILSTQRTDLPDIPQGLKYQVEILPERKLVFSSDNLSLTSEDQVLILGQLKSSSVKRTYPEYLPEDITLKELTQTTTDGVRLYFYLIELPQRQLFIILSADSSLTSQLDLSNILKTIYWKVVTID